MYGSSNPPGRLPDKVATHPLLGKLSPELRDKVMAQLHVMAGAKGGNVALAPVANQTGPRLSDRFEQDWEEPPPNHTHAISQTTFPSDAAVQTDDAGHHIPTPHAVDQSTMALPMISPPPIRHPEQQQQQQPFYQPPPQLEAPPHPSDHLYKQSQPQSTGVGTYSEAAREAGKIAGGNDVIMNEGVRGEAHARLLAERVMAENNRRNVKIEEDEVPGAMALGFPGREGDRFMAASEGTGLDAELKHAINNEFWHHFNAEFDRAVTARRDPELDSLLGTLPAPAYSSLPANPSIREGMRSKTQALFWDEYTSTLDAMMPQNQYRSSPRERGGGNGGSPSGEFGQLSSTNL